MRGQARNRGLTQAERLARDQLLWEYRVQGLTYEAIASRMWQDHQVSISDVHVSRCIARVSRQLHTRFIDRAMEQRLEQVAILEHQAMRAFQEFERSCRPAEIVRVSQNRVAVMRDGAVVELPDLVETTIRPQAGDAKLLMAGLAALSEIRKILGYNAPQALEVNVSREHISHSLEQRLDQMAERLALPPPAPGDVEGDE